MKFRPGDVIKYIGATDDRNTPRYGGKFGHVTGVVLANYSEKFYRLYHNDPTMLKIRWFNGVENGYPRSWWDEFRYVSRHSQQLNLFKED
uniref:Uncharacterized protein n=1 Tax=viral metagenome TaxID=1070528 RepID=A0A6M3LN41_9ZZZZ